MSYPLIRADRRAYVSGGNGPVSRVVIHTTENAIKHGMARNVAGYFAGGADGRHVSAHYCVDPGEIVQCVDETDEAFHAPPNKGSIGVEFCAYSGSSDFGSPDGLAELELGAGLIADVCRRHALPAVYLTAADLLAGRRGITTHHQVSLAWHQSTHTDPDPSLPVPTLVGMVAARLSAPPAPIPVRGSQEDIMLVQTIVPAGETLPFAVPPVNTGLYGDCHVSVCTDRFGKPAAKDSCLVAVGRQPDLTVGADGHFKADYAGQEVLLTPTTGRTYAFKVAAGGNNTGTCRNGTDQPVAVLVEAFAA